MLLISWTYALICQHHPTLPAIAVSLSNCSLDSTKNVGDENVLFKADLKFHSNTLTSSQGSDDNGTKVRYGKKCFLPTVMELHYILQTAHKRILGPNVYPHWLSSLRRSPGDTSCMYKEDDATCTRSQFVASIIFSLSSER